MLYTCLVSNSQNAEIGQIYDTILSYMLSYMTPPSFMSAVSTTAPQEELPYDGSTYSLTLTDTNNVIGNYSFSASDTAVSVEVSGESAHSPFRIAAICPGLRGCYPKLRLYGCLYVHALRLDNAAGYRCRRGGRRRP